MRPRLVELLACPIDRGPLDLVEWEGSAVPLAAEERGLAVSMGIDAERFARDVETGLLLNRRRKIFYPIIRGVPRLLVFETGLVREFAQRHRERLSRDVPSFSSPAQPGMPGEADVLRTFSTEWLGYKWDGRVYWGVTAEQMFRAMRFMLDLDGHPVKGKRVLEVGIGIGGIADYVQRSESCELVGIDLSYAVDAANKHFRKNSFFHIVQASAFAPPFPEGSFDLVYSQGVIHCTFSTRTAFEALAGLPRKGGRLYIWVYSPRDESRTVIRRGMMALEGGLRPIAWRLHEPYQTALLLPLLPLYWVHQNLLVHRKGGGVKYGWREALHAARDRFTPRYVYRHTEDEVANWFDRAGYRSVRRISERPAPEWVPVAFTAAAAVDGVRGELG